MTKTNFDHFSKSLLKLLLSPLGEVRTNFEITGKPKVASILFTPSSQPESYVELEGCSSQTPPSPEDEFSQGLLGSILSPFGRVQTNYEIPAPTLLIDIWFSPSKKPTINPEELGTLGKIVTTDCVIVPFEYQPAKEDIRHSLLKLMTLQENFESLANLDFSKISEKKREKLLPRLWIIAPSISEDILSDFGADKNKVWPEGIYFMPPFLLTRIIVINKLPKIPKTLCLRLLGEGEVRQQAINEVISLPKEDSRRDAVLELLETWKIE